MVAAVRSGRSRDQVFHFTQGTLLALMRERSLGAGAAVPAAVAAAVVIGVVGVDDEVVDLALSVR